MKPMMTLLDPQLNVFVAVAKYKSMHAAAKVVHLTQTAITQRIRALERRLHTTLFIRTRHGVMLTPDGEALLRYCYATQELAGETLASLRGAGIESTARIAISGPTSIMISRIIPRCSFLLEKYPHLLISFDVNDSEQRINSLQTGINQFAIIEPKHIFKEMKCKQLIPEKYVLVASSKWKKRSLKDILKTERIIDFYEADPMTLNYLSHYDLLKYTQMERHFVNITESLISMLIQGYGYGVLTKEISKNYVESKQLILLNQGKCYENPLSLAWYARPEPSPYFSDMIDAIT
jgi:LysR family transcriptional regulator, chromosome initiation inhibitor